MASSYFQKSYIQSVTTIFFYFLFVIPGNAQTLTRYNFDVITDAGKLKMALAGGFNNPQFSEVDINGDGIPDLFVFDRSGNGRAIFINNGTKNKQDYVYAPEWLKNFPDLIDFALMRDFDGDGVPDIFTYSNNIALGIKVFKGFRQSGTLTFTQIKTGYTDNVLNYPGIGNQPVNLYVNSVDVPAIADMDGDGDLDILSFEVGGGNVHYYKNMSVERGYKRDSLVYELSDNCWGNFFDSGFLPTVKLGSKDSCATNFTESKTRHPGSTITTFDANGDGVQDVLYGSISYNTLTELLNGGTKDKALITVQNPNFISNAVVNINTFPAGYFADVDNDGLRDLLISPSAVGFTENTNCSWYCKNIGTAQKPVFSLVQKNFLVADMVDVGSNANVAFIDYNADGLQDLVIGNYSYFNTDNPNARNSSLQLFKNTGTPTQPQFTLVDNDWLKLNALSSTTYLNFSPVFYDMDGDGDLDVVVGDDNGALTYFENTAGVNKPVQFATPIRNWQNILTNNSSKPTVVDLNRDGLPDLVIGNRNGNLLYFQNIGTKTRPQFNSTPTNNFLGKVDVRALGSASGFSAPQFLNINNKYLLLCGSESGKIYVYDSIENNLTRTFRLIDADYGKLREGGTNTLAFADLNGDKKLEIVVGNVRGGIAAFATEFASNALVATDEVTSEKINFEVFPNPADEVVYLKKANKTFQKLFIYNLVGQCVKRYENYIPDDINIKDLESGTYFILLEQNGATAHRKFIKM